MSDVFSLYGTWVLIKYINTVTIKIPFKVKLLFIQDSKLEMDFALNYKQLKSIRQVKGICTNFSLVKDPPENNWIIPISFKR